MLEPSPLNIFRGEEDHLFYKRASLASVEGDDPGQSQTLDIYTVIFFIVTFNTYTKAGRRGFTSPRSLNLGICYVSLCSAQCR
jgi:hypothetical protein